MRLPGLYLLSRRASWALLVLTILALATSTYTGALIFAGVAVEDWALIPTMIAVAPAVGSVVGVSTHSPFGDVERTVARPIYTLRAEHLGGLILCAVLLFTAVLSAFDLRDAFPEYPLLAFPRNVLGYAGIALIGARLMGARISWLLPFVAIAAPFPWTLWSGTDTFSWLIALSLFAIGFIVVCLRGARDSGLQTGRGDG